MFEGELLAGVHETVAFDCGVPELNTWLTSWALAAQRRGTARTFVWCREETNDVVAYFSLAPTLIVRDALPARLGRGEPESIPAILLARLALDRSLDGQDLGAELLLCALDRAVAATQVAGGRYVVVDAIDERAATFYEHFGFQRMPDSPARHVRLVRKVSDISASLGS